MDSSTAKKTFALIKQKEFSLFILTRFTVIFSLFLQTTVVSYLLYSLTKDPLSLGLVGLSELVPAIGFAFFAGYFVDKHDKRTVYLTCILLYLINAVLIISITSSYFLQHQSVHVVALCIYAAMFFSGCIRAFLAPSSFSLLPLLIKREETSLAVTWSSTSWLLGSVLGPLFGGLLMASIGVSYTLILAGFVLLISLFCIVQISPKPIITVKEIGFVQGLAQGFRFVFRSEIILAVLALDLFAVLFGGAEALLPVYAKEILHVGPVGYGWLRSAHGIGAICLMFILAYLPLKNNIGYKLLACIVGFGICIILFGVSKYIYFSFAMLFMAGLFDGVSVVIRHSILQLKTPEELKGRVSSINMMFISSSNELGAFESGFTARFMGTIPAVVFGGVMTILIVGFTYFAAPNLKKLKLE